MEFSYDCWLCHLNQGRKVGEMVGLNEGDMEMMIRRILKHMSEMSYEESNPATMARTWEIITEMIGDENPYGDIKKTFNAQMLSIFSKLYKSLKKDPLRLQKAIHLAVEGNIIDFGAKHVFSEESAIEKLTATEKESFAIDDSEALISALYQGKRLLYIGDNCGEIVMDKLFIKLIKESNPQLEVTYGVRGRAVLNDVTMEDADQVGMADVAKIINNGTGALGMFWFKVSRAFEEAFQKADVIISKGQGNFESLSGLEDPRIYFLFMAKCETVANDLGVPVMSKLCLRK